MFIQWAAPATDEQLARLRAIHVHITLNVPAHALTAVSLPIADVICLAREQESSGSTGRNRTNRSDRQADASPSPAVARSRCGSRSHPVRSPRDDGRDEHAVARAASQRFR